MKRDLVVFGEDWGALPSSTQHLISHLSGNRKIVWINSIGLRQPRLTMHDINRGLRKLTGSRQGQKNTSKRPLHSDIHFVNPRTFPVPRSNLARKIARNLLKKQIIPVIERAGLKQPILWTSLPTAVDMAGHLGESALVYYCGDDFSALAGVDHTTVSAREMELAKKANLILTASEKLVHKFADSNKTHLLPHGVDYPLFATETERAADLPDDGKPIAGFYGSISNWLDVQLMGKVCRQMPDWHFIFIGKVVTNINDLKVIPNVRFLGERSHQELPAYSQHWTVSMLPFVDNSQIQSCNPLKLLEYLAAGRPVVSTSFPALAPFKNFMHVVDSAETMITALHACKYNAPCKDQQQAVRQHTWSARASQLEQLLEQL